jgi:hypothetical protein
MDGTEFMVSSAGMMKESMDSIVDMWMTGIRNLNLAQDQMEAMLITQVEMSKSMREEMVRVFEEFLAQMRQGPWAFGDMYADMLKGGMDFNPLQFIKR